MSSSVNRNAIESAIARARRDRTQIELLDEQEPGLRFRAGERSAGWSLLARLHNGKRSRIKLGAWPKMGIADARRAARTMRVRIDGGVDPNVQKREAARAAAAEARNRKTLGEVLDLYDGLVLVQHRRGEGTRRALDGRKGLLRSLKDRVPSSITRAELADLVKKHARWAPISANRKLAYASAFFNWCIHEGIIETNPAQNIRKPARENVRDRFHTLEELTEIWAAAGTLGYPFAQLYRLLIALPNRRDEVAAVPLAELDLGDDATPDQGLWLLPADRTKRGNALRIPLSPLARAIIIGAIRHPDRPKNSKLVFTTTGDTPVSGFAKAKRRLDAAIAEARMERESRAGADAQVCETMPPWTIHDLRTTFNTHACEILDVPPHVADRILNHVATATRSKIMRVYNKSELFEPRRQALVAWADLLLARVVEDPKRYATIRAPRSKGRKGRAGKARHLLGASQGHLPSGSRDAA